MHDSKKLAPTPQKNPRLWSGLAAILGRILIHTGDEKSGF